MATRLGVVSYLNTKPLVYAFESGELVHPFDLIYAVPSFCADQLHAGRTDLALIPSIEIARSPEPYLVVRGVGIGSIGPVRSVLLVLNKEPEDIRSLALDISSRTSVALSQVVLNKQFGVRPEVFTSAPDLETMLSKADAALLIGDSALELDVQKYRILDLGEAWTKLTGLPFVYACWTGRPGALTIPEMDLLSKAKEAGVLHIPEIASKFSDTASLTQAFYADYLSHHIKFDLGEMELEGMNRFYAYATEMGLIEARPEIRFYS